MVSTAGVDPFVEQGLGELFELRAHGVEPGEQSQRGGPGGAQRCGAGVSGTGEAGGAPGVRQEVPARESVQHGAVVLGCRGEGGAEPGFGSGHVFVVARGQDTVGAQQVANVVEGLALRLCVEQFVGDRRCASGDVA